jgi:hypothetical protein
LESSELALHEEHMKLKLKPIALAAAVTLAASPSLAFEKSQKDSGNTQHASPSNSIAIKTNTKVKVVGMDAETSLKIKGVKNWDGTPKSPISAAPAFGAGAQPLPSGTGTGRR